MLRSATILAVLLAALTARAEPARLVTAGSAVTEIAATLGLTPQIVAVDTSGQEIDGMGDRRGDHDWQRCVHRGGCTREEG